MLYSVRKCEVVSLRRSEQENDGVKCSAMTTKVPVAFRDELSMSPRKTVVPIAIAQEPMRKCNTTVRRFPRNKNDVDPLVFDECSTRSAMFNCYI